MVLLCDGGLAINMLSSILMNGVCCLHNLSAEEERNRQQQEELRRTINVEYERQRLFDKECRDRMRREEQLLAEKQWLVAEQEQQQQQQQQQQRGGGVILLCDNERNNAVMPLPGSNDQLDTKARSDQCSHCPRRALMAKKLQLSSPLSLAATSSPSVTSSVSPCETFVASRPIHMPTHPKCSVMSSRAGRRLSGTHNFSEETGKRRRFVYQMGWNDIVHRGAHVQRDDIDMSSSCASSTVSLFDDDSSDEEAE